MFAIECETIALAIWRVRTAHVGALVPIDAKPLQVVQQLIFVAGLAALKVGVFDAQDHGSAGLAGKQPVVKCGAGIADVQLPGRRRSETDAYLGIFAHTLMLAREGVVSHAARVSPAKLVSSATTAPHRAT